MASSEHRNERAEEDVRLKRQLAEQAKEQAIIQKPTTDFTNCMKFIDKHQDVFSSNTVWRVLLVARSG